MTAVQLRCVLCGADYPADPRARVCPRHEGLQGILDVVYPLSAKEFGDGDSLDRYSTLLPLTQARRLPAGYLPATPSLQAPRLARELGVGRLLIKDEGRNPTGSLKDRSSALAVELAAAAGCQDLICASTGNAASSLAGACAAVGLTAHILVPAATPAGKLAQLKAFGAHVVLVEGSYDDAYYLCEEAADAFGWYDRNCAVNPYLVEGKKTCALEIAEQVSEVDWVSVAVGDGCTVAALGKGFSEMVALGKLPRPPRLLAVQPAGAAPIAEAFLEGTEQVEAVLTAPTIAESVAVGSPRNAVKALRAVRASGGSFLKVSDADVAEATILLGRLAGVFAEPGAAAGLAGVRAAVRDGLIGPDETVVHVVTGTGLKTVSPQANTFPRIPATLTALREVIRA